VATKAPALCIAMRTFRPVIIHDGNGQLESNILPFYRQGRLPHETAFPTKQRLVAKRCTSSNALDDVQELSGIPMKREITPQTKVLGPSNGQVLDPAIATTSRSKA
jgi:hypothetical protein